MKTKTKLIVGIAVAIIIGLFAYNKMNAEELSGNFSLGYNSDLSFRGTPNGTAATQASVGLGGEVLGLDVTANALTNLQHSEGDNEVRLSAEAALEVVENFSTALGIVAYDNNSLLGDQTEIYVDIGSDFVLNPSVRVYYSPTETDVTVEGSVSQALKLSELLSLEAVAQIGNTPIGEERATYYGVDLVGSYSVGPKATLFAGVDLVDLKNVNIEAPDVGFYGGFTYTF